MLRLCQRFSGVSSIVKSNPVLVSKQWNKNNVYRFSKQNQEHKYGNNEYSTSASAESSSGELGSRNWFYILPVIAFGLGTWQVYRLQWKKELIEAREQSKKAAPVPLTDEIIARTEDPTLECTAIKAEGKFLDDEEFFLGPRSFDGVSGSYVITPFQTKDGKIILVNRGWIPRNKLATWKETDSSKHLTSIVGYYRTSQEKKTFVPENKPEAGTWHWFDIPTMAKTAGASPILIYLKGPSTGDKYPLSIANDLFTLPNNHMQYVVTWYSTAVALTAMAWTFTRNKKIIK